jgi:hypothetical protein
MLGLAVSGGGQVLDLRCCMSPPPIGERWCSWASPAARGRPGQQPWVGWWRWPSSSPEMVGLRMVVVGLSIYHRVQAARWGGVEAGDGWGRHEHPACRRWRAGQLQGVAHSLGVAALPRPTWDGRRSWGPTWVMVVVRRVSLVPEACLSRSSRRDKFRKTPLINVTSHLIPEA